MPYVDFTLLLAFLNIITYDIRFSMMFQEDIIWMTISQKETFGMVLLKVSLCVYMTHLHFLLTDKMHMTVLFSSIPVKFCCHVNRISSLMTVFLRQK